MTPHRHFCTYFDHRYLARGLALHGSLSAVCPRFTLWVLALDREAEEALAAAALPNLRIVPLPVLEAHDPELKATRAERSLVEYYFTCSPCLPRFVFAQDPDIAEVTYLDSDLFFFDSPEPVFAEMAGQSVGIVPHRFSPKALATHGRFGAYNVGWLTFRNDADGRACLDWWRGQCLEWCHDYVDGDRYADQKYLEQFATHFHGVHEIAHPGANLAPWNVARHRVALHAGRVEVDGRPLVFFHFQGFRHVFGRLYDTNLTGYGARLSSVLRRRVFAPYLDALSRADAAAQSASPVLAAGTIRRHARGLRALRIIAGRWLRTAHAAVMGNLIAA